MEVTHAMAAQARDLLDRDVEGDLGVRRRILLEPGEPLCQTLRNLGATA